jgi:hypothetical protein
MTYPRHQCVIYEQSPSNHLLSLARTLIGNLKAYRRCMYLNSPAMVAGMRCCLAAEGLDLNAEIEKGSLILTSDQGHLLNGLFDVDRMLTMLQIAMQKALADGYKGLWASGDMTWEFGSERNFDKLLEYERRLEEFMQTNDALSGVCQYHRETLPATAIEVALCSHRAIYVNETLSRLNPRYATAKLGAF